MGDINLVRLSLIFSVTLLGILVVLIDIKLTDRKGTTKNVAHIVLGGIVAILSLLTIFLWINHINFPLNLEVMEGTILQSFRRAAAYEIIYPEPEPGYVPLAYNALYYILAIPFSWIFGVNLFTLRLVAILGAVGSGLILILTIKDKTKSVWWGLLGGGLYLAAYVRMDTYLDTAHADSWLLFSMLLGSFIIDRNRGRSWNLFGVVILVSSFWFKQHGALFAIGGVLFLTWREGIKDSIAYWLTAFLLGPLLYLFGAPSLLGPSYHYFTWEVPREWSELNLGTFRRFLWYILKSYPVLALTSGLTTLWTALQDRKNLNIWHFQLAFTVFAGFMGALDPGSSNNVFIPMGAMFIVAGTLGIHDIATRFEFVQRYRLHLLALFITLAFLAYNPLDILVSPKAGEDYKDLVTTLKDLDGSVYGPSIGQLQEGFTLYPNAHWVALEDMIRGPGKDTLDHPNTRRLLQPAIEPGGPAYILANYPLDVYYWLAFLEDYYILETDLGDRYKSLGALPHRWETGWPQYIYRFSIDSKDQ